MCFVITDEIFPVEYLKSQSITNLDVLVLPNSLSSETTLFFVKTQIIHALAETTSEAYCHWLPHDAE